MLSRDPGTWLCSRHGSARQRPAQVGCDAQSPARDQSPAGSVGRDYIARVSAHVCREHLLVAEPQDPNVYASNCTETKTRILMVDPQPRSTGPSDLAST